MNIIALAAIVIAIIVIVGVAYTMFLSKPLTSSTEEEEELDRLTLFGQPVTALAPAEGVTYKLLVVNINKTNSKTYYLNVFLDNLGGKLRGVDVASKEIEVKSWLTYSGSLFVPAEDSSLTDISVFVPGYAEEGIYLIRIIVCGDSDCVDFNSPSFYASEKFVIEVEV